MSLEAKTVDSRTGARAGFDCLRRRGLTNFPASIGEVGGEFLPIFGLSAFAFVSHQLAAPADLRDPQIEDALVLVDLRDELSEIGEDRPEDDAMEGLAGLMLDSEIQ